MSLLLFLLMCEALFAQNPPPVGEMFYDLRSKKMVHGPMYKQPQQAALGVLFQADCGFCRAQMKDLRCLPKSIPVYMIGSFSTEDRLIGELKHLPNFLPAYLGDFDFLKKFKLPVGPTPQLIFFGTNPVKTKVGIQKCGEILKEFRPGKNKSKNKSKLS